MLVIAADHARKRAEYAERRELRATLHFWALALLVGAALWGVYG